MAKATAIQLLNKVQENLGEAKTASANLATISGLALLIFNTFNEVLMDIANDYKLQQNEIDVNIPLSAGVGTYTASVALTDFDKDSFNYNNERPIPYYTKQRADREYPIRTSTGVPSLVFYWGGYFNVHPIPQASEDGKFVRLGGWKTADQISTAVPEGTTFMPEGFDLTLLANLVTFKILAYKSNPEAQVYYAKVYGTSDGKLEGQLDKLKRLHGSPQILDDNIMVEPINASLGGRFVQKPITG